MLAYVCMVPFSRDVCDIGDLAASSSPTSAPARAALLHVDWHICIDIDHQPDI